MNCSLLFQLNPYHGNIPPVMFFQNSILLLLSRILFQNILLHNRVQFSNAAPPVLTASQPSPSPTPIPFLDLVAIVIILPTIIRLFCERQWLILRETSVFLEVRRWLTWANFLKLRSSIKGYQIFWISVLPGVSQTLTRWFSTPNPH